MRVGDDQGLSFGKLLRRARIAAGLTQEQLAEMAGLSTRGISDLEREARRMPRQDTVDLLVTALGLGEEEQQSWRRARTRTVSRTGKSPAPPMQPTALAGRKHEIKALDLALEQVTMGYGQMVLIAGEPGIGKTRLAEEVSARVRNRHVLTLWGRCYEGTGTPAYWPWIQILRSQLDRCNRDMLRRHMGSGARDLALLLPELYGWWPDLSRSALEGETSRFRLFESMVACLTYLAEDQPLVMILDDLQWADQSSLLLLTFLAREIRAHRVLLLGLYRDTEIERNETLTSAVVEVIRQPGNQQLSLGGLHQHEVQSIIDLLVAEGAPPGLADRVAERTGGNPFYVVEIVRYLGSAGTSDVPDGDADWHLAIPIGVRELIRQRLGHLSAEGREAVEVASVIGREFDLRLLHKVSHVPAEELLDMLEEAVQEKIVRGPAGVAANYRFVHDLIRETIYDDLTPSRRIRLHEQTGLELERLHETESSSHYTRIAHHFLQAVPVSGHWRAINYLDKAGNQAMCSIAYDDAAKHYANGIELLEHYAGLDSEQGAELVLNLGEALRRSGRIPRARETFQQAAGIARRHDLTNHLARAAIGFSGGIVLSGRDDPDAQRLLREASQSLGPEDSALKAQCLARAALAYSGIPDAEFPEWRALSIEAVEIARRVEDPEALAIALHAHHRELWGSGRLELRDGMAVAAEMVDVAKTAGNDELLFTGLCWQMFEPLVLGDMRTVDRLFAECEQLASELRQPFYTFMVTSLRSMRALLAGRLAEAEALTEQARLIAQDVGVPQDYDRFWWWLLTYQIYREYDQFSELEMLYGDSLEGTTHSILMNRIISSQLALLHASEAGIRSDSNRSADVSNALAEIEAALTEVISSQGYGSKSHTVYALVHLAEAASILRDESSARRLYELLVPDAGYVATVGGSFMCVGSVAHYCGLLSSVLGRRDEADQHFRDALRMNEQIGARPFATRTRYAWANLLLEYGSVPGDRGRASDLLDAVDQEATQMGMISLKRQAKELRNQHFTSPSPDAHTTRPP